MLSLSLALSLALSFALSLTHTHTTVRQYGHKRTSKLIRTGTSKIRLRGGRGICGSCRERRNIASIRCQNYNGGRQEIQVKGRRKSFTSLSISWKKLGGIHQEVCSKHKWTHIRWLHKRIQIIDPLQLSFVSFYRYCRKEHLLQPKAHHF